MNFKTTFVLLLLLVLVGGFLLWDKDHPEVSLDQPVADGSHRALFDPAVFPVDKVATVTIVKGSKTVTLTKEGSDWFETQPVRFKLNSWSAKRVGDEAAALQYTEKIKAGGELSLSEVHLDKPLATVTVTFKGDQSPVKLLLGRKAVGGRGYLMLGDTPKMIYVVNDSLHKIALDDHVRDWRNKSLEAPTEGKVQTLVKTDEQGRITLIKSEGQWVFGLPHVGRVSREAVSGLLGGINGIYIDEFVEDNSPDLSVFGLDHPSVTVAVSSRNSDDKIKTQTLLIGSPVDLKQETFFAMWLTEELGDSQGKISKAVSEGASGGMSGGTSGGAVFTIKKSDREKFSKTVDEFRDPRLTLLEAGDVTSVSIQPLGKSALNLERGPSGWSFADPKPAFEIDQDQAKSLLEAILNAKAQSYVPHTKRIGPVASITLTATGRPQPTVLHLFADASGYLVLCNQETTGYRVDRDALAQVFEPVLSLRDRQVSKITAEQVQKLAITLPDRTALTFTRKDGVWTLEGHATFEAGAFDDLLRALSPLKADKWVASAPVKVTQSPYRISLEASGQTVSFSVDVASGIATSSEGFFKVSDDLARKLTAELRNRTVLDVARTDIKEVTRTGAASVGGVILVQQADKYIARDGRVLDESAVGALIDTLAGLQVEHFVKPKKMQIKTTLKIRTATGEHLLELGSRYARLGETYFVLSQEDASKLTAKVSK